MVETWKEDREILPGVTLTQPGGHFPGSAVVHWAAGAEGRGVLLSGDTIFANPDRTSVSFMRSYPNRIPLSGAVTVRVAEHVARFGFDRLYNNLGGVIEADAREVVLRSALPGICTGVVLSVGRSLSETAAVMLTAGTALALPRSIYESSRTLALHFYTLSREGISMQNAYATASLLIVAILGINIAAYWIMRRFVAKAV